MFKDITIAFIGSGTMAEAMIRGLLTQEIVTPQQIIAAGPRPERGHELKEKHGVHVTTDNRQAAEEGQIVVLSTKPQVLSTVLGEIRGHLRRRDLLLSILAGVPIYKLANGLANDLASTVLLATDKPVLLAPAMNVRMWDAAATQRNIALLEGDVFFWLARLLADPRVRTEQDLVERILAEAGVPLDPPAGWQPPR